MWFCVVCWSVFVFCLYFIANVFFVFFFFFFSSRRRHTRWNCDWSSDVYSSDLFALGVVLLGIGVPLLWVFIASKLSDTFLKVPLLPLVVMVAGLFVTYMVLAGFVARFDKERAALRSEERRVGKESASCSGSVC